MAVVAPLILPASYLGFEEKDPCSAQCNGKKNILWETGGWLPSKGFGICSAAVAMLVEPNKLLSEIFMEVHTCTLLFPKNAT